MEQQPAEHAAALEELLSFSDCPHLLRAVDLPEVLHLASHHLGSSAGSASTYLRSKTVASIDLFLSHNWCIGRWYKYVALSLYFNFTVAFWLMVLVMVGVAVLSARVDVPTVQDVALQHPVGIIGKLSAVPTFVVFLFLLSELRWFFPWGCSIFLDKLCIHQTDAALMRRGIQKLGAFIAASAGMLVLYSQWYLRKAWTVYEVACFLAHHNIEQMHVLTRHEVLGFFGVLIWAYAFELVSLMVHFFAWPRVVGLVFAPLVGTMLVHFLRMVARHRREVQNRLASFEIQRCMVSVESDRPLIYRNIAMLMGAKFSTVDPDDEPSALLAFDFMVREMLPLAFGCEGRNQFSYLQICSVFSMSQFGGAADFAVQVPGGVPIPTIAHDLAFKVFFHFVLYPWLFDIVDASVSWRLDWTGCRERLWIIFLALSVLAATTVAGLVLDVVKAWCGEVATLALLLCVDGLFPWLIYLQVEGRCCRCLRRQTRQARSQKPRPPRSSDDSGVASAALTASSCLDSLSLAWAGGAAADLGGLRAARPCGSVIGASRSCRELDPVPWESGASSASSEPLEFSAPLQRTTV